jgi:hypothetical protein
LSPERCTSYKYVLTHDTLKNLALNHEVMRRTGGKTPRILKLYAKWRRVVTFALRLLYLHDNIPLVPTGNGGRGVMLTTNPLVMPRVRKCRGCNSSHSKRLHGV